jgi:hypothetical protein
VRKALRFVIADMGGPSLDAEPVFELPAVIMMERPGRRRFQCNPSIVLDDPPLTRFVGKLKHPA